MKAQIILVYPVRQHSNVINCETYCLIIRHGIGHWQGGVR